MKVFISYRRSDTQDLAGRIADRLRACNDIDRVFIDVDGIEPGADFASKIDAAIDDSDVCLVLIGESWRGSLTPSGTLRIFEDRDFIRREVAAALSSGVKVVPVLANGVSMPAEEALPHDLRRLTQRHALSVRHADFERDIAHLIETLRGGSRSRPKGFSPRHPILARIVRSLIGAFAALVLLVVAAVIHGVMMKRPMEETLGGSGNVWMVIAATIIVGAVVALFVRLPRRSAWRP